MSYKIISGIYTITNKLNGKIYVGYAKNIQKRLNQHKNLLLRSVHQNKHLQGSFNKYGIHNFDFELLEECEEHFLTSQEHYWVIILNSTDRRFGYNIRTTHPHAINQKIADETKKKISVAGKKRYLIYKPTFLGKKHSEETKQKMREIWDKRLIDFKGKDRWKPKDQRIPTVKRKKKILQYDLAGHFIKEWDSKKEVEQKLNISIRPCLRGKSRSTGNFVWRWKIGEIENSIIIPPYKSIFKNKELCQSV